MTLQASRGQGATAGLALAALQADRNGKLPAMVGFLRGDELQAMFPLSVRRRRQTGKIDTRSLIRTREREEICALAKWLGLSEDRGRVLEDVSGATRPRRFIWHGRSPFPRRDRVAAWARLVPRTGLARDGAVTTKLEVRRAHLRRPPLLQLCESGPLRRSKAPPRRLSRTEALVNELKLSRNQLAKANERLGLLLPEAFKATVAPPVDDGKKGEAIAAVIDWFEFKRKVVAMSRLVLHAQLERNRVQVRAWVRLAAARKLARHLYRRCIAHRMHAAVRAWRLEIRRRNALKAAITLQRSARYFLSRCRCHKVRCHKAASLAAALKIECAARRFLARRQLRAIQNQAALTIQRFAWSALRRAEWRRREQRARQRANTLASLQLQCAARRMLAQCCYGHLLTKRRNAVLTMQRSARAALKRSEERRKDSIAHQWESAVPLIQRFVRNTYLPQRRKSLIEAHKWQLANRAASRIQHRVRARRLATRRAHAAIAMIQRRCRGCLVRTSVVVKRDTLYQTKRQIETSWPASPSLLAPESTLPFVPLEAPVPVALFPSNMELECWCAEGDARQLNPSLELATEEATASVILVQSIARGKATRATHRRSIASLHELRRAATLALLPGEKLKRQLAGAVATSTIARKFVRSYEQRRAAAVQNVQRVYRGSRARASILFKRVTAIKNVQRVVRGYQARVATHQLHDIVSMLQERTHGSFVRRRLMTRLRASAAYNRVVSRVYAKARQVPRQNSSRSADVQGICGKPSCSPCTSHNHVESRDVATMTNLGGMNDCATQPVDDYDDDAIQPCDVHNTIARRLQPVAQIWLARRELDQRRRDRAAQEAVASFVSDLVFPKQTTDSWTSPTKDTGIVTRSCATQTAGTTMVEQKDPEPERESIVMHSATQPESVFAMKIDGYWEMRDAYVTAQNSTYGPQSTIIQRAWRTRLGRQKRCTPMQAIGQCHVLALHSIKPDHATVIVKSARETAAVFKVAQLKAALIEAPDKARIQHRAAAAIQARVRGVNERSVLCDKSERRPLIPTVFRNQVRRAEPVNIVQCWTRQVQAGQIARYLRQERLTLKETNEKERKFEAATVIQSWTRRIQARLVARHVRQERRALEETIKTERKVKAATIIQCWTRQVQGCQAARRQRQELRTLKDTIEKERECKAANIIQCWIRQAQSRQAARRLRQERRTLEGTIDCKAATVIQCWTRQVLARQVACHVRQFWRTQEVKIEKAREFKAAVVVQCWTRQVQARQVACHVRQLWRTQEDKIEKAREFKAAVVVQCWTRQVQARQVARHLRQERRALEEALEKEREFEAALDKMKRALELDLFAMRIQSGFRRYMARCRLEQQLRALVEAEQIKIRTRRFRSASRIQALARGVRRRAHFSREKSRLSDAKVIRAALFRMQAKSKAEIERIEARLKHLERFGPSEYLWSSVRAEIGKQSSTSQLHSNSEVQLAEAGHGASDIGGYDQPSSFYGWIQQYDDSAQATYWYNTITGEATWLEPTEHQQDTYTSNEPGSYYTQGASSMVSPGDYNLGAGEVEAAYSAYYGQPNTAVSAYGIDQEHQWLPQSQEYPTAAGASYLYEGTTAQEAQHAVSTDYYDMHT